MLRRRDEQEDEDQLSWRERRAARKAAERPLSARVALAVLMGGAGLVAVRALVATLIQIHGDGMAPTILDGESVVMTRGAWGIEAGDIVVYDPAPPALPPEESEPGPEAFEPPRPGHNDAPEGSREGGAVVDRRRAPRGELRNTAVVDVDEVESNWERVQGRHEKTRARNFRVGRVLAVPGDTVTFHAPDAALGLIVNGRALGQKLDDPIRLVLAGRPAPGEDSVDVTKPRMRALAWETLGDSRYPVLVSTDTPEWSGMALPRDLGPIEIEADGYLILADNRDEGACCDSRELGWIAPEQLRGEIVLRLAGDPSASPDSDPRSRGLAWLP